ncbi:multidrug and toxin extrusion protein 1-like isoform X1 [Sycon ciliatum]|uniref:multidrug and toxin extrusion protein 1-like isoform X1 n=1 Tax=Sycon ciliatum TaxID=27933 RepID=UPI0031F6DC5E
MMSAIETDQQQLGTIEDTEALVPLTLDVDDEPPGPGPPDGSTKSEWQDTHPKASRRPSWLRASHSQMGIVKEIAKLAVPVGLSLLVSNMLNFQTVLFCGHAPSANNSANETRELLDAAALSTSFANVTGMAVLIGAATACDTLFAQAYGGRNKKALGIIVQQSMLILSLVCVGIAGLWLNSEAILLAIGQDPGVARLSGEYMDIMIVGLPGTLGMILAARYLQSQSITLPAIVVGIISNVVLGVVDYILVFRLGMGLRGAAIGFVLGMSTQPIATIVYIRWRKLHHLTWPGWSFKCLDNWMVFTRLALAGGIMVCLEWWAFEILLFVAGHLGQVPLAVTAVMYQAVYITGMVAIGLMIAVNILVGNALGAGDWKKAKSCFRVALVMNGTSGIIMCGLFLSLRNELGKIFTDDPEVIHGVAEVVPYLASLELADYIQCACAGVIRGAGRQSVGAVSNIFAYYAIALPVGVPLALRTTMGVRGLWLGMGIGLVFQATMYLIIISRIDWEKESIAAQQRVKDAAGDKVDDDDSNEVATDSSSPVELVAVMATGENGDVQCRIAKKSDATNGDVMGEHGREMSESPSDDAPSDMDSLLPGQEGVARQDSYTDVLFSAQLTPERKRRLIIRRLLVSMVPVAVLFVCAMIRLTHHIHRPDVEDGGEIDHAFDLNITANATTVLPSTAAAHSVVSSMS